MASTPLNPQLADEDQQQNFLGYSKGQTADRSSSELIDGITDVSNMVVGTVDAFFKNTAKTELTSAVDTVRDAYGPQAHVDQEVKRNIDSLENAPPELKIAAARADKLTRGYQSGTVRDSSYWGQLDSIARQMRARYPGYREFIDNTMSNLVGATPANKLVEEVRRQALAGSTGLKDEAKDRRELIQAYLGKFDGVEDLIAADAAGKLTTPQAMLAINSGMRDKYKLEADRSKIETDKLAGEVRQTAIYKLASSEIGLLTNAQQFMTLGGTTGKEAWAETLKRAQSEAVDGSVSPDTLKQVLNSVREARAVATARREAIINKKQVDGTVYGRDMKPEDVDRLRKDANESWDQLEKDLANPKFGILAANQNFNEAVMNDSKYKILKDDYAKATAVVKDLYGDIGLNLWLSTPDSLTGLQKAIANAAGSRSLANGSSFRSAAQYMDSKGLVDPKAHVAAIDKHVQYMKLPSIQGKEFDNAVNIMFGKDNEGFLARYNTSGDQQRDLFTKIADPAIAKKIHDSGPANWDKYTRWTTDTFAALNGQVMSQLKTVLDNPNLQINGKFDPKSGTFDVIPRPEIPKGQEPSEATRRALQTHDNERQVSRAVYAFREWNKLMLTMQPTWSVNGEDPALVAKQILESNGIPLSSTGRSPETSKGIIQSIQEYFTKPTDKTGTSNRLINRFGEAMPGDIVGGSDAQALDVISNMGTRLNPSITTRESTNVEDKTAPDSFTSEDKAALLNQAESLVRKMEPYRGADPAMEDHIDDFKKGIITPSIFAEEIRNYYQREVEWFNSNIPVLPELPAPTQERLKAILKEKPPISTEGLKAIEWALEESRRRQAEDK